MHKELANLFMEYKNNNKPVEEFIRAAYEIIVSYDDLKNTIRDLKLRTYKKEANSGEYDPINKDVIVAVYKDIEKFYHFNCDLRELFLTNYLCNILHESNHAIFLREHENGNNRSIYELTDYCYYYYLKKNKKIYNNIIEKILLLERLKFYYQKYHNGILYEMCAIRYEYDSLKKIASELEKIKANGSGYARYQYLLADRLLKTYENLYQKTDFGITTSPTYECCLWTLNKKYNISDILSEYAENPKELFKKDAQEYTLEERIKYGLLLSNFEYDQLIKETSKECFLYDKEANRKIIYERNKR